METLEIFAVTAFAALIHASFQLSISTLTLMSGHAIGKRTAHAKLLRLTGSFLLGAAVMTLLLVASVAYMGASVFGESIPPLLWSVVCGILLALGVSVWLFYYRPRAKGTVLWLPRGAAKFLSERSKKTHSSSEAFGLGLTSVVGESIFLLGPISVSALALIHLSPLMQLAGVAFYVAVSLFSLTVIGMLIGGGYGLGRIQKWRETNKRFLQFAAGSGLLILGVYVYVEQVMSVTVRAVGGF